MTQENNKKWSPLLVGTLWFLWGTLVLASALWISDVSSKLNPLAFVTQQFVTTTPFVNPNPGNPGNPQVGPNANPVNPQLFGMRNFLFRAIMNNPNLPAAPICKVAWSVIVANQPWQIHFDAQKVPAIGTKIRCGLIDTATNLLVDLAPVNAQAFDFFNVVSSDYRVVCLVWQGGALNMNSFNRCADGTFTIANGPTNPPTGILPIDLELKGELTNSNANGGGIGQVTPLRYVFKVVNMLANGWVSSGAILRFLPQNLTNIVATGSVQSGSWYERNAWVLNPGSGVGLEVFAEPSPTATGALSIVAELCNYTNDIDSQPCNIVNLTPAQDDEIKL